MKDLKITEYMLQEAKANKSVGWLYMDPVQFLSLAVTDHNVYNWIEKEIPHTKSLDEYNSYKTQMPWLDVDMETGKVVGHEGRHRAAACIKDKCNRLPVAIILRDRGYSHYYSEPFIDDYDNPKRFKKKFVTKDDVPKVFVGQFVHRSVLIDPSHLHEFWAQHNTTASIVSHTFETTDDVVEKMSHICQGKPATAPGGKPNAWQDLGDFIYKNSLSTGNVLLFGEEIESKPHVVHAILLDAKGNVLRDPYQSLGGYDITKGYWMVDSKTYHPLLRKIPVSELTTQVVEANIFLHRAQFNLV